MKSLLGKVGVILIGLFTFSYAEVWGGLESRYSLSKCKLSKHSKRCKCYSIRQ
jgi:hypothetical protein